MNIPEGFQDIVKKSMESNPRLKKVFILSSLAGDKEAVASVMEMATASSLRQILKPTVPEAFYPPPTAKDFKGKFYLGTGVGYNPSTETDDLTKGIVTLGSIGVGKTNSAFYDMQQFHSLGKKFLHLGFKQSVRHFEEIPILTLTTGTKVNFYGQIFDYPPPGVDVIQWDLLSSRVFGGTTYILDAGQSLLLQVITELRREGKHVNPTTILEKLKKIKTSFGREGEWKATLINRFTEFNIVCGGMFSREVRFPLEKLIESHNIEIELDSAGHFAPFIATMIIAYLYEYRKANNIRGNKLITPIMCDELHSLVNTTMAQYFQKEELPLLDYMRKGREFGIGLVLFTNEIKTIPSAIKTQAHIKIMMRCADFNEIQAMGSAMNLTQEQMELCLDLPVGWGIVKIPEIAPFLTYFPLVGGKDDN
ncbi:MAG: hypothetical protein WC614_10880 [bacterium]